AMQLGKDFDKVQADAAYRDAFHAYGLDVEAEVSEETVERIQHSAIRDQLLAALDNWAKIKRIGRAPVYESTPGWERLLEVAQRVDADPWRQRLRQVIVKGDRKTLVELAASPDAAALPPATLALLASALEKEHEVTLSVSLLRRAQKQRPADFWINQN